MKAHGDADNDGDVDAGDLSYWETGFGQSSTTAATAFVTASDESSISADHAAALSAESEDARDFARLVDVAMAVQLAAATETPVPSKPWEVLENQSRRNGIVARFAPDELRGQSWVVERAAAIGRESVDVESPLAEVFDLALASFDSLRPARTAAIRSVIRR